MRAAALIGAGLLVLGGAVAGLWRRGAGTGAPFDPGEPMGEAEAVPAIPAPGPSVPAITLRPGAMPPGDVLALAEAVGIAGLTPAELLAYVEVESSFMPAAYRWEARLGEASYGLMQVLESTARDRGLDGPPTLMFDPETGLRFGLAHVEWTRDELARRGASSDPLSVALAYNAGVGGFIRSGGTSDYRRKWTGAVNRWRGRGVA